MNKDERIAQLEGEVRKLRKQLEGGDSLVGEELRKRRDTLETFDKMPNGAIYRSVRDLRTGILKFDYLSSTWEKILGITAEETMADMRNVFKNGHPEDLPLMMQLISVSLEPLKNFDIEVRYFHPVNEKWIWLQISSYPRREGDYVYADGFIFDITNRKLAEIELEKYREHLEQKTQEVISEKNAIETLIHSIPNASLVRLQFDPSGLTPETLSSPTIWRERLQFVYAKTNWDVLGAFSIEEMKSMEDVLHVFDQYHPDDVTVFRSLLRESLRSLSRFKMETRFSLPGKEMQWHQISGRSYRENGMIIFDFFFFDITERKNTELALAESESKQRFVFDNTKDVFWVADFETSTFTFVSGNCYETFGVTGEEYIGMSLYDWYLPENRGKIEALIKQQVKEYYETGVRHFHVVEKQYNNNREEIWVETTFQFVPDENGKITQIVGVEKDIDKRKRIEIELANYRENLELLVQQRTDELTAINEELASTNEQLSAINDDLHHKNIQLIDEIQARLEATKRLENSESRLRDFIEQSYAGIIVLENDGRVSEWNKAQTRLTGISREEALGEDCWEIWRKIVAEEDVNNYILYMINVFSEQTDGNQEQTIGSMEVVIHPGAENQRYAVLNTFLIKQEDGYRLGMMCRDITVNKIADMELERYRTQLEHMVEEKTKELVAAKEKAEESDRLKSAFLANMSHEIRTPLNAICGILQFIDSDITPDQRKEYIKIIENSSVHLLKLIDDIIDISKIEAKQMTICPVPVQLNELMYELHIFFEIFLHSNNKEHIDLILDDSKFINPSLISVDPVRLRQVLINLISNAIKFTEEGHIRFGYRQSAPDQLEFVVEDTGIGLPADQQEVIFERFRQVQSGNNRQYGGTGLGLAISRNIVQLNGGKLWVESVEGKGSAFYFTISYMPITPKD